MPESPASATVDIATYFKALAEWWREGTGMLSSPADKASHPAYRKIIEAGPAILPYLFRELEANGGSGWYAALRALTGESPVPADSELTSQQVKAIWLDWGRKHGYL